MQQGRQGEARQNGGAVAVSDAFSLSSFLVLVHMRCALLVDNNTACILIQPSAANNNDDTESSQFI